MEAVASYISRFGVSALHRTDEAILAASLAVVPARQSALYWMSRWP